jgi:hypothetical protein
MKHLWVITKRGKISKYYDCKRCGLHIVATSRKQADLSTGPCEGTTWIDREAKYKDTAAMLATCRHIGKSELQY